MIAIFLLVTGVALIAYKLYKLSAFYVEFFEKQNIKYVGVCLGIKNFFEVMFNRCNFVDFTQKLYNDFPNESIFASFLFSIRQYVVRNPEVYKRLAIKDFDYFEDHKSLMSDDSDDLFANSLFLMRGQRWREMRATLSPSFTGSKMRLMFELVTECADDVMKHFQRKVENGEKINVEMKDFFARYTNDVIASCAFGIKINSFTDPDNEFFVKGKKIANFGGPLGMLKMFVLLLVPKIGHFLNLKIFSDSLVESFKSNIMKTIETRKMKNIVRPDMINIIMQLREGNVKRQGEEKSIEVSEGFATVEESEIGQATINRKWSDNDLLAQCFIFFFAGYETSSTILTFVGYELVANPDIQQRLYEEVATTNDQLGGKRISYDGIQKMKYLDQVVCETLRKWPSLPQMDRVCVKDYLYDDGKLKFVIEKGTSILYPVVGIHRDPQYFPNPDKFDPERFSDENKHNIVPGTYTPFGVGPRNCIGSRFALMTLKSILYHLLLNFSFEVNEKTQIPLKLKKGPVVATEKGVHLELKPRNR